MSVALTGTSLLVFMASAAQAQTTNDGPPTGATAPSSAALGTTAATAPQNDAQASGGLDDIIVTARRVSENLQSVPVSVTAISGTSLEQRSVRDLKDVGQAVPNLYLRDGPQNPSSAYVTIRGQSQPDQPITIDSTVGLYIDGVNYPHAFGTRANSVDIERVEVLRGPQGTLYGKNTTGGALSIITRNPTDEMGASFKAFVGNYQSYGGTAIVNLPVADGAALRVVGTFNERDKGFGRDGAGHELGKESARFLRGKLKLDPTDALSIVLAGDYQRYRNSGSIFQLSGPVDPGLAAIEYGLEKGLLTFADTGLIPGLPANFARIVAASAAATADGNNVRRYHTNGNTEQDNRFTGYGFSGDIAWDVSDTTTLRSITSYRHYKTIAHQDLDGTSATFIDNFNATPFDRNITQEFQLLGKYDTVNYVFGLYGADEKGSDGSQSIVLPFLTNARSIIDATVRNQNIGAFVQATWRFTPSTSLTGGFRYTSERKGIVSRNRSRALSTGTETTVIPLSLQDNPSLCTTSANVAAGRCSFSQTNTFTKPSWLVSLDHKPSADTLIYAKASRSFRGGGQNIRGSGLAATFASYRPEVVTEYEIGFKSEFWDRRARLNGALFTNNITDLQKTILVLTPNGQVATVLTNAAKARLRGGEIEGTLRLGSIFTLNGGLSYTHGKYKSFTDFTGDRTGEPFPTPEWQGNIGGAAALPTSFGKVLANLDYYRQSKVNTQGNALAGERVTQKAYGLLNARVALQIDSIGGELALFGKNLTKTYYYNAAIALDASLGYDIIQRGEPRTFGLEYTMRFGGERR